MTTGEVEYNQNNFDRKSSEINLEGFIERNKLACTIAFVVISIFLLGIQILPYIYGGSLGHFHSTGSCGWPNDCSNISSFVSF